MILKKQFEATVARLGLDTEVDQCLAEIIWERCEAAHTSRSIQEPALLKKKSKPFKRQQLQSQPVLSQSELQFLTAMIADIQSEYQEVHPRVKGMLQQIWLLCDPDDKNTLQNFKALNKIKTLKNKSKEHYNKVSNIQRKLKKMR